MYGQNEQNPIIRAVRAMLTTPLFLVGAIGYSVYGVFQFINRLAGGSEIRQLLNMFSRFGGRYSSVIQRYGNMYSGAQMLVTLLSVTPVILIAVGMWLMFASAKSTNQPQLNVTGLTMIRVVIIIQLICVCLVSVIGEIVLISAMVGVGGMISSYGGGVGTVSGIFVVAMLVVAAVAILEIFYYLKLGTMVDTMKNVILTGVPDSEVSKYVEIFCYVMGGLSAISALMSLVGMSMYSFLTNAGLATADISFAIFMMKYRTNMNLLIQNPNADIGIARMQGQPVQRQGYQNSQQGYQNQPQQGYQNPQQSYQSQLQQEYQNPWQAYQSQPQQGYQNPSNLSTTQDDGTTVLQYYNETSVLSGQFMSGGQMLLMRMTRQKTGETICISKPSFWIGKDAANVDYCISDNSAISRRHALITVQNNGCYVRDNHSTNRVFVNGQVLPPDVDTPISGGDRIRLGDEEFIVSIG